MFVKDLMSKNVVTIEEDELVYDACKTLKNKGVGCLIVTKNGVVNGIITERDMIDRIILDQRDPKKTKVFDVMTKNIKTIHASAKLEQAAEIMSKNKIKRLPVILNNEISGIITVTDLANTMPNFVKEFIEEQPFKFI